MQERRIVGMDLGITSSHVVAICDGTGTTLAKRKCRPTRDSTYSLDIECTDAAVAEELARSIALPEG